MLLEHFIVRLAERQRQVCKRLELVRLDDAEGCVGPADARIEDGDELGLGPGAHHGGSRAARRVIDHVLLAER